MNEDLIGKRILPITGALLLLAALGYWTPVAYRSLSQIEAFAIELLLSFTFAVGGRFFAKKSTFFGEVISGIGAGALLVTIMAGYQFHHLYSGTAMVSMSLAASVGIGVIGMRLGSRTFEGIGAIGGLVSAWMPMNQHDFYVSAILQFLIVSATLAVFVESRWKLGVLATTILGFLANYQFSFESHVPWQWKALAFCVLGLESAIAYAYCSGDNAEDPENFVSGLIVSLVGMFAFGASDSVSDYSLTILLFSLTLCGACLLFEKKTLRQNLFLYPGVVGLLLVTPAAYSFRYPEYLPTVLAVAYSGWAIYSKDFRVTAIALAQTVIALIFYVVVEEFLGMREAVAPWVLLMASVYILSLAINRQTKMASVIFFYTAFAELCLSFAVPVHLLRSLVHGEFLISALISVWGLILIFTGVKVSAIQARACGYALLAFALGKVLVSDLSSFDGAYKSAILTFLGLAMLIGGYVVIRNLKSETKLV